MKDFHLLLVMIVAVVGNMVCDGALTLSQDQLEILAEEVCQEYEATEGAEDPECVPLIADSIFASEPWTDKIELQCINDKTASFHLDPQPWKLVLITVPDNNTQEIITECACWRPWTTASTAFFVNNSSTVAIWTAVFKDLDAILYSIFRSDMPTVINILPDHQLWIANISSVPIVWKMIQGTLNCSDVQQKIYNITEITSTVYEEDGKQYVEAQFEWDSNLDDIVTVNYFCKEASMGPGFPLKIKSSVSRNVTIRNLNLEDTCQIKIDGQYGRGNLQYTTASLCDNTYCAVKIDNLTITAVFSQSGSGYDVFVKWPPPPNLPSEYNITLYLNDELSYSESLPNTSTEYTFKHVNGENDAIFYVTLMTISKINSVITRIGKFPLPKPPSQLGVIIAGTWCLILSAGIIIVCAVVYVRRRRYREMRKMYYESLEEKLSKEYDIESSNQDNVIFAEDCWELKPDRLLLHEVIGEGAFGVVRRGSMAPEGKKVAVKMLKDFPSVEEVRSFRAEMELMKSVGVHSHVVNLVGCCSGRSPMIVAEYCSQGDLLNYLRCSWDVIVTKKTGQYYNNNLELQANYTDIFSLKTQTIPADLSSLAVNKLYDIQADCEPSLTVVDLLSFCRQIVLGMEFLASNRVVHRDLAARNILVTEHKTLKIADFGLSRDVYQENQYKQKGTGKLPIKWMAIESLTNQVYTTQSDVWSFGIVMWEIVTVGGSPYPDVPVTRLLRFLKDGYRMPKPNNCSEPLYEVMRSCWRAHPRDRPTFSELHIRLDTLLNGACADEYLNLEVLQDYTNTSTMHSYKYFGFIPRLKRPRYKRTELYEKPVKSTSNHYTDAPYSKTHVISSCSN